MIVGFLYLAAAGLGVWILAELLEEWNQEILRQRIAQIQHNLTVRNIRALLARVVGK